MFFFIGVGIVLFVGIGICSEIFREIRPGTIWVFDLGKSHQLTGLPVKIIEQKWAWWIGVLQERVEVAQNTYLEEEDTDEASSDMGDDEETEIIAIRREGNTKYKMKRVYANITANGDIVIFPVFLIRGARMAKPEDASVKRMRTLNDVPEHHLNRYN